MDERRVFVPDCLLPLRRRPPFQPRVFLLSSEQQWRTSSSLIYQMQITSERSSLVYLFSRALQSLRRMGSSMLAHYAGAFKFDMTVISDTAIIKLHLLSSGHQHSGLDNIDPTRPASMN